MDLKANIERILWTEEEISVRVSELASQITLDFAMSGNPSSAAAPVIVGVATGAFVFLADLVRKIHLSIVVDLVRIDSYGSGTVSSGKPKITCDLKVDVRGRDVIVVEDIVDTGTTLSFLIDYLKSRGSASVSVCTLLNKSTRRKVNVEVFGRGKFYSGFECDDSFVVGYGLDFAEQYRNLPYVGVLKPELYQ